MAKKVWVFSDKPALMQDITAGAKECGEVSVIAVGSRELITAAAGAGADTVYYLGDTSERMAESYTDTIAKLVEDEKPEVLLFGATLTGRAIAGRLAARLGTSVLADAKELDLTSEVTSAVNMVYGGGANLKQSAKGDLTLVILGFGVLEKPEEMKAGAGKVVEVSYVEPAWRITLSDEQKRESASVNLAAAKKIVSIGLGIANKEDIPMVKELADALDAELGCSRPIAEGLEWLPKECYIGISGVFVKSDLYLAVGISGQVQHMVGLKDAKILAAINKDANAPIMRQCDYGIVGDLYEIVPALAKKLSQ